MFSARFRHLCVRSAALLGLSAALLGVHVPPAFAQDSCLVHALLQDELGQPVTARVSIKGSDNGSYRPLPDSLCIYHTSMGGYFYGDGAFDVTVPAGSTRFRVSKGFEYTPVTKFVDLHSDTSLTFTLERWIDLPAEGWYCGDAHMHLAHQVSEGEGGAGGYTLRPEDGLLAASGEGLNVAHFLDNDYHFSGAPDPVSTADCIVYFSEEYRSFTYGHLVLMGLDHLIRPWTTGPDPSWPMNEAVFESLRTQTNTAASYAHPMSSMVLDPRLWPGGGVGRELPIDALNGRAEALDVQAYTNGREVLYPWYHLLGSRIKIWGSAGTDACINRIPDTPGGGFRVYVDLGDSAFTYDRWVAAFREGRSFFTSGPLFKKFELGGAEIGDSLVVDPAVPTWVEGTVSFASGYPVEEIEIVHNGHVVRTIPVPAGTPQSLEATFDFLIDETGWIAARARCRNLWSSFVVGDTLLAHTNPIFIRYGDDVQYAESDFWVFWLHQVLLYLGQYGSWEDPYQTIHVYQELETATDYYESVVNFAPSRPTLMSPPDEDTVCTLTPTLWWTPSTDRDNTVFYTVWYGTDSTFAGKTVIENVFDSHCDPAAPLEDSTRYFWRVCACDSAGHRVWSDDPADLDYPNRPCSWAFTTAYDPDCVLEAVGREGGPGNPGGFQAYPNPFNPGTTVAYDLLERSAVSIRIFDVEGRLRAVLFEGLQEAGAHRLTWSGRNEQGSVCGPGVYFCRAQLGSLVFTRKLVLLK